MRFKKSVEEVKKDVHGDIRIYRKFAFLPTQIEKDSEIETRWLETVYVVEQYKYILYRTKYMRYLKLAWMPVVFLTYNQYKAYLNQDTEMLNWIKKLKQDCIKKQKYFLPNSVPVPPDKGIIPEPSYIPPAPKRM